MMRKVFAAIGLVLISAQVVAEQKQLVDEQQFGSWKVLVHQDSWGDEKEIVLLESGGSSIYINPKFGFVIQDYRFDELRDRWPYCEVTRFAYRIDGGTPKQTGMGGKAAAGGSCASLGMPGFMLADMRTGKLMEVRAGASSVKRSVRLEGFSEAWDYAAAKSEHKPRVETWMRPY